MGEVPIVRSNNRAINRLTAPMSNPVHEVNIIERVLAGEKHLFALLIEHYQSALFNLAIKIGGGIVTTGFSSQKTSSKRHL